VVTVIGVVVVTVIVHANVAHGLTPRCSLELFILPRGKAAASVAGAQVVQAGGQLGPVSVPAGQLVGKDAEAAASAWACCWRSSS
jgi:hypothetical protein